jgi:hypothetical protein
MANESPRSIYGSLSQVIGLLAALPNSGPLAEVLVVQSETDSTMSASHPLCSR